MSKLSQIGRRIAELEHEIKGRQHEIAILRAAQKSKPKAAKRKDKAGEANGTGVRAHVDKRKAGTHQRPALERRLQP